MNCKIFDVKTNKTITSNILATINASKILTQPVLSQRIVGDSVQEYLEENFSKCIPNDIIINFNSEFARRSMEDFAFTDMDNNYYAVDCKTHNIDTHFNMPNLISVKRLANFYKNLNNYFCVLMLSYSANQRKFQNCIFVPIEFLDWNCLTIGSLGFGQLQIANSNNIILNTNNTRKQWMLDLCDYLDTFYDNEIIKIGKTKSFFQQIREFWLKQ